MPVMLQRGQTRSLLLLPRRRAQRAARQRTSFATASAIAADAASASTSSSPDRLQQQQQQLTHPVVFHDDMRINPIPDDHRFPMMKDAMLYDELKRLGLAARTFRPSPPDVATLCLAHDEAYVRSFLGGGIAGTPEMRRIGLPWSPELVTRTLIGVGSAVLSARLAVQYGAAVMCNGGTHHAHRDRGAGWCIFHDQAVAARAAQRDAGVGKVLFVDLDVHQGDGTASIFAGDPSVFTFSVHCAAQGFPSLEHASDLDVALPAGTGDEEYMEVLRETLPRLLREQRPDLVMYQAGADVSAKDQIGKMSLTDAGILARDRFVMRACAEAGAQVAAAIGGGYAEDRAEVVSRHVSLHRAAAESFGALSAARERRRREEQEERQRLRLREGNAGGGGGG